MPLTVRDVLAAAAARLAAAGVDSPRVDAELLLGHVLGCTRTFLFAHALDAVSEADQAALEPLLRRREAREPLPYLLGAWEFLGLRFHVSPAVLIPRPETELLVEEVARRLPPGARVLDVGTGTGCIAVGLAVLAPGSRVIALEASAAAAAVARRNAADLGVSARVEVLEGYFPEGVPSSLPGLDAVVSNPPYIPSAVVDRLPPELLRHEPRLALDGGADGLEVLRSLVERAPFLLRPGGLLAVEVMQGQAEVVADLLRARGGWQDPEIIPDLAGIPRVVLAATKAI